MSEHGLTAYGYGCRCDLCRAAKAAYMRNRRAAGRQARLAAEAEGRRHIVEGTSHGLAAYQERGCRCMKCRLSNAENSARVREKRAAEKGAA